MAHPLTPDDLAVIAGWKKTGVLLPIRPEQIPSIAFVWSCGDGDRFEQLEYLFSLMRGKDGKRPIKPHLFTWNGGPILFSSESELTGHKFARQQFLAATKLKPHFRSAIMQGHLVCGAADHAGLGITETLRLLKNSFDELKRFVAKNNIATVAYFTCLVHVDYGNGTMKTYTFNSDIF